jgi:signal transduction histidine kinase/CheY-like chemotaxis protein
MPWRRGIDPGLREFDPHCVEVADSASGRPAASLRCNEEAVPTNISFRQSLGGRMLLFGVLPTAVILLGINAWLASTMVSELRAENEHDMQMLAERVATEIDRGNTRAVLVAQVMAFAQANGMFSDRRASVAYSRQVLEAMPELTGAYFGYEPNSDLQDGGALHRWPELADAMTEEGRFIPYWFRDHEDNEVLRLEPLVDMETSLYYQGCKEQFLREGRALPMVTEPYVYEGKMIVEQTYPIVIDGSFVGIAGVDRALSDIETFLHEIKERDEVDVFLVSRAGKFVAATIESSDAFSPQNTTTAGEPLLRTKRVDETTYGEIFGPLYENRSEAGFELALDPLLGKRHYFASASIATGDWMVVLSRSEATVTAPIREKMIPIVTIVAIGLLAVAGLSLWVTRTSSARIRRAVDAADRMALGDATIEMAADANAPDETGRLNDSFQRLAESYREITQMCVAIAQGDFSRTFPERSDKDVLAVALNEMSSKRQQAEQAVVRARDAAEDANRAKSDFLAKMSHELRTPMNAIIGYSEMLEEEAEDLEQAEFIPDLQKIQAAGRHLLALINDILDLSKIEAGKMDLFLEHFDVASVIQEVAGTIEPLARKNSNTLVIECADDVGSMHSDLVKLRQGLFNLLSNACKFTKQGTVRLSATRSADAGGDRMSFSVSDNGIGMSEDEVGRIFEAFGQADSSTTRQFGGTGLGLTITRRFSEMLGGGVSVASEKGVGSTFTIELPAESPETPAHAEASSGDTITGPEEGPLILAIDDDASARDLLSRTLAKEGFRVATATNGDDGLRLARELQPVAVTLDVMMPGLDGWAVLSRLKADPETAQIPVVMCTILRDEAMAFSLGASDFITKPIDRDRLVGLLGHFQAGATSDALVIEDDPDSRDVLVRLLAREGWKVRSAENGAEGLERVAESKPGLILLDLMMPVMDGFEFLSRLRSRDEWRKLPVIVVSAKDLTPEEKQFLEDATQRVVTKGSDSGQSLLSAIGKAVEDQTQRA